MQETATEFWQLLQCRRTLGKLLKCLLFCINEWFECVSKIFAFNSPVCDSMWNCRKLHFRFLQFVPSITELDRMPLCIISCTINRPKQYLLDLTLRKCKCILPSRAAQFLGDFCLKLHHWVWPKPWLHTNFWVPTALFYLAPRASK